MTIFTGRIVSVKADSDPILDVVTVKWGQVHVVTPQLLPSTKKPVGWLQGHSWAKGEIHVKGNSSLLENDLTSDVGIITELEVVGKDVLGNERVFNLASVIIINNELAFTLEGEPVTIYYFLAFNVTEE